jgi:hypothetical protein
LEAALQELRRRRILVVWVDALCINQANGYEKVYQLRQMGTIFSKATKVVAWLGPEANSSSSAMTALAAMQTGGRYSLAITSLLGRPYWGRVWIVQELAKASDVEIWCGPDMLPWVIFIPGVETWWSSRAVSVGDFGHPIMTLKFFRLAERNAKRGAARMLLSTAMVRTLHTRATLNRDKIYALLGVTRDGTETVQTPNYVQDDATVFGHVFRHMIVEQGQLNLVFLAGIGRTQRNSPSWLPQWDNVSSLQPPPWLVRCFTDVETARGVVKHQQGVLAVSGQILGRLQASSGVSREPTSVAKAADLLRATAWQLLKCRWTDHFLESVPSVHDLAAAWRSPPLASSNQFPMLRRWYEKYADVSFAGVTLRTSVAALSRSPQTLRALQSPASDWLQHLETAASTMSSHKMDLRMMNHLGLSQMVMVPQTAEANHYVAKLKGCSLPVVLANAGNSRYGIVGEVVDLVHWDTANSRIPPARGFMAREAKDNTDSDDDEDDVEDDDEVDSENEGASESDEDDIDDPELDNIAKGGRVGMQLCADNLGWGAGYAYGSGRASNGDWRHLDRARWVTMYLV